MEPRIQYARTADGVSIAFWTLGEGTPLVHLPVVFSHIQMEWQVPECRRWYESLAEKRKLVRFDPRGSGLSDRDITELSLDAWLLDMEAVVDRLGLGRFALLGPQVAGPGAIAYAARHPERVSHLLLWCTYAHASDWFASQNQAARALTYKDWALYRELSAHVTLGWSAGEPARRYAALIQESVTPEFQAEMVVPAVDKFDVTPLLAQVRSPTLVLHRRQYFLPVDVARGLASRVPDARLVLLEGESGAPYLGDTEAVLAAIDEFLGEGEEPTAQAVPSGLVTILFTDIESSTVLRRRLGDAKAQELVRIHNSIVRDALKGHGGREIKHTGDGIMASFPTASGALECAIIIQRAVAAHVEQHPEAPLAVYIGLNAGEPMAEEKDLFGTSVDLARRICDNAQPGQILASDLVAGLAAGKGFVFEDEGEASLKGFDRPVRLYELRWREDG